MRAAWRVWLVMLCLAWAGGCAGGFQPMKSEARSAPHAAFGDMSEADDWNAGELAFEEAPIDGVNSPAEKPAPTTPAADSAAGEGKAAAAAGHQRVILYSASLGLYVFDLKKALAKAVEYTKEEGGYMQASTSRSVTLRVPVERFEGLMARLDALGDISYRNVTGTDVTEEFLDLEIRLKNAQALRDRLALLFAQAKSVEDSLAIEKELARVTGEIERMKGRLRYLKDRAAYSVITVKVEPKSTEQVVRDHVPLPFGWLQQYGLGEVLQ